MILRNDLPKVTKQSLIQIYTRRLKDRYNWMEKCMDIMGFVPRNVYVSHVPFLLMQCLELSRGTMAAGNWLDLGLDIYEDRLLGPEDVFLTHPFLPGMVGYLENGSVERWEDVCEIGAFGKPVTIHGPIPGPTDPSGDPHSVGLVDRVSKEG
jgi:hypothetical protein